MDRWEFRIGLHNQSKGVDLPFAQWGDKGIDMLLGGTSVILLEAEGWDSFPESPPMVIEAPLHELFVDWLDASFDLHGKLIDAKRFSPRQLYEALSQGWEYGWAVDGPVPQEPGDGDVFESAPAKPPQQEQAPPIPQNTEENIKRGKEAMNRVINGTNEVKHAMYRGGLGWIEFRKGTPGSPPPTDRNKLLNWWKQLSTKREREKNLFKGGNGVSHIVAKRDWEGKHIKEFQGQSGKELALKLVEVLARGKIGDKKADKIEVKYPGYLAFLAKNNPTPKTNQSMDVWLLSGYAIETQGYELILTPDEQARKVLESVDVTAGVEPLYPTHSEPTRGRRTERVLCGDGQATTDILFGTTHPKPTGYRQGVGAADSVDPLIPQPQPQGKEIMSAILERDAMNVENEVRATSSFGDILRLFKRIFGPAQLPPTELEAYKSADSDYGLKVRGKQARAKLNAQAKSILERVDSPEELTAEDRAILLQYSGRGGTDDNSQYEYYTPTPVAEGMWEALKANGFENGNVLEPSCGAGVFLGTKPGGVVVSGNDIDPTSSKVARLLNPTDVVSNQSFESIAASTEDDTYDGVIGNVPFGRARGASMHEDPAYKHERRIERYFLLRILDKLKPGRLACLICPTNVLGDKGAKWKQFRVEASKKAEFLGAHKLPSKTFAAQGTDTVVDVLVFRKHPRDLLLRLRAEEIPFETLRESKVVWDEFVSGKYWLGEGKRFIHGTYFPKVEGDKFSRERVDGDVDGENLKRKIAIKFHSRIDWEMLETAEPIERPYANGDTRSINGEMWQLLDGTWQKMAVDTTEDGIDPKRYGAASLQALKDLLADNEGALKLNIEHAFAVFKDHPEMMSTQQKDAVQLAMGQPSDDCREQIYRGSLLGAMIAKMGVDEEAGEDVGARRLALQSAVVAEVEKYGHPANNRALSLMGASSKAFGVFKNSIDTNGRFSDLLAGRLDKARGHAYNADDVADVVNHLSVHRDEKAITLEDLKALYTGNMVLESLGDVAQVNELAITPAGTIEPLDVYCSGDVAQKIAEMQNAMGQSTDPRLQEKMQRQIDYLLSKMKHTKAEDITFGLRHKWFSKKYIVEFLRANGFPDAQYCILEKVKAVDYDGRETVREEYVEDYNNPDGEFLGLGKSGFGKQFADYLIGKKITSSRKDNIEQYRKNAAEFEEMFDSWMKQHPEIDELESDYNLRFNGFVQQEYSSTELEEIKDVLSGEIVPHSYQNAEVRRLSNMGSGICGFGVGLGKSFTALAMAAYNAKKGRAKRTCLVVPSAVLENWYHESRTFYNEAYMRQNVLFVGLEPKTDKEGNVLRKPVLDEQGNQKTMKDGSPCFQDQMRFANTPAEIYDAMWKIPQSNYKLVVMTKEKFQTIPLRKSTMVAYTQKMVDRHLMSSKAADGVFKNDAKKNGKKSYADDVKHAELEGRFSDERTQKKQELPYLEDMGFDSIITDESHFFKNSLEGGKDTQGIAFLPTAPTSAIAVDMNIKSDYIRSMNGGRGVYGLTATPVTNSPIEIFNMLSLVAPIEEFERFNVRTVDDFVRQFGKIENKPRMNVATDVKEALCLTGFENLDGLRNLFAKYVNIKTVEDVDSEIHVPNAEEEDTEVPITEEQEKIYQGLRARARAIATQRGGGNDSIFSVMRDMDRTTTDMDMYLRQMTFIFPEKHREAIVKMVPKLPTKITVKVTNEETGEKEERDVDRVPELYDEGATLRLVVDEAFDSAVVAALAVAGVPIEDVSHPISPKYAKLIENCRKHMEMQGKQLIFTEEKTQHQKIARMLTTQLPISLNEIGIINAEDAAGAKLDQISKAYNAGGLKIVVANKKAEVGVNLQKGTTAIHHLTLPWTPASINQRNGRGVRQGNKAETVKIYYYCGKGTFDSYRKELLKGKANWINTLLTGKASSVENGDMAANEEMLAVLSGNLDEYRKRKAAEEAKRQNKAKASLVNKLQRLISIKKNLENIDERKTAVKHDLTEQRDRAERDAHRLEARLLTATSEEERKDIQEKITAAKKRAGKKNADLNNLDAKFDAERVTLTSNKNAVESALRLAAKKGELPFEEKLIDNAENCVVSLEGEIFSLGDALELFEPHGGLYSEGIYRVERVDAESRRLYVVPIVTSGYASGRWVNSSKLLSPGVCQRCSYSESELNLKGILASGVDYAQLAAGRIDKQTFLDNVQQIRISDSLCIIRDASGAYRFAQTQDTPREQIVYPEPGNADFRKGVFTACLAALREGMQSTWRMESLMRNIFGNDWEKQAAEYGTKATPTEISAMLARLWVETEKEKIPEQFLAGRGTEIVAGAWENLLTITLRDFAQAANSAFREKYDNNNDFSTALDTFVGAKRQEIRAKAEAIALAKKQSEDAKLREHPDFKEVPEALAKRFAELGLTVRYNTKPATLGGRKQVEYAAFARLFLKDSAGFGGRLYRSKEILKSRFKATFTKEWSEGGYGSAWWHVPATVEPRELYELLA